MSCMNNIDPYNNAPPSKTQPQPQPSQYVPQNQYMPQPSKFVPQHPREQGNRGIDPVTENNLLKKDLELAVAYIRHLGGTWPPPGH